MQAATACGVPMQIELLGYNSLITRSRNPLVARFLDTPGASHLLFVDADIGFEVAQVARMLQLGEDLVAGMYPLKLIDWDPGALARAHAGEPVETAPIRYVGTPCEGADRREPDGFLTGLYAGTGFMLLRRAALEAMIRACGHTRHTAIHTGPARPTTTSSRCSTA